MVLTSEEVLVVIDGKGETDLVAGRAELRILDRGLQECPLVHLGLGLDQRLVHPPQDRRVARGKGIMLGFLDRIVGIAPSAVDVRDRVADRTRDSPPGSSGC